MTVFSKQQINKTEYLLLIAQEINNDKRCGYQIKGVVWLSSKKCGLQCLREVE